MSKKEICKEKENKRQNENAPNYKREVDISLNSKNEEKPKKGKKIRHQSDLKNKEGSNMRNKDKNQIKETKIKFNNCSVNIAPKPENDKFLDDINNNIERNKMNNLKIKKLNKSIKEKYHISNFDSKLKEKQKIKIFDKLKSKKNQIGKILFKEKLNKENEIKEGKIKLFLEKYTKKFQIDNKTEFFKKQGYILNTKSIKIIALLINYILTEFSALIEDIFYSKISRMSHKYKDKYIFETRKYKNFEVKLMKHKKIGCKSISVTKKDISLKIKNNIIFEKERKKNLLAKNHEFNYIFYLLIIFLLLINSENKTLSNSNSIFLNINQTGCHRIFFNGLIDENTPISLDPQYVYVNGEQISPVSDFQCFDKRDNIIELKWDSFGEHISGLFFNCSNITKIDFSKFGDSSLIISMFLLFYGCSSLTSIDFTNFETDSCYTMDGMFSSCSSLRKLNLSSFNTYNVNYFREMFYQCYLLSSLDISNFNFNDNSMKYLKGMFRDCYSLTSINLSNMKISLVEDLNNMFSGCKNLTFLDISGLKTNIVIRMDYMFYECKSLISLNLYNFETDQVNDMQYMFYGCSSLKYLNISKFNTHEVNNMKAMFYEVNLDKLNLEHFITTNVEDMSQMFYNCKSLTCLIISNFDTKNVKDMSKMFYNCISLISLDVSNFYTSSASNMSYMFYGCSNLKYLDLNNFNTENVLDMSWMFYECYNLTFLNISTFKTSNVINMDMMFIRCRKITSLDISSFNTSLVTNLNNMFEDCRELTSLDLSNFITDSVVYMRAMFLNCSKLTSINLENFYTSKVTTMEEMFFGCYNLKYINLKNTIIQENTLINNMINNELKNLIVCINDEKSFNEVISLYQCPFIDVTSDNWGEYIENIFPEDNNKFINNCVLSKYDINCYEICSYLFYFDENLQKYLCTKNNKCPETHDKLIVGRNECVKSCNDTKEYKLEYNGNLCLKGCPEDFVFEENLNCIPKCPWNRPFLLIEDFQKCVNNCTINQRQEKLCVTNYKNEKGDNFSTFDIILNQIRYELIHDFNKSVIDGNVINENGINITITQTNKMNNNDYFLNFSKCENELKKHYTFLDNDFLYLLRIDTEQEGMEVPSFDYELFYLNNNSHNLEEVDLSFCKGIKVDISIPINLKGNLDKYNRTSDYYNDICYPATDQGTDIILSDRQNQFINNNMSICEPNCDFIYYNNENKKAICSCNIKTEIPLLNDLKFDKNALKDAFMDINNIMNIKLLKCYKAVFQPKNIMKNYGFFIFSTIFFINSICLLLFMIKYFKGLMKEINKVKNSISIFNKNEYNNKNKIDNKKNNNRKLGNFLTQNMNIKSRKRKESSNQKLNINGPLKNNKKLFKNKKNKNNKQFPPIKRSKKINLNNNKKKFDKKIPFIEIQNNNINNVTNMDFNSNNIISMNNMNKIIKKKSFEKETKKNSINFNTSELNSLSFHESLSKDKRSFIQYYISLLKINHIILFIFNRTDYNSKIIKFSIFLFNISAHITVNALFFNDSTMHKIYIDNGSYNIIYQLPQIIYSSIISGFLNFVIKFLGLSGNNVLKFKQQNYNKKEINNKYRDLIKKLKIKIALYFIIDFLLLVFFWYYITSFCGIYKNTQIHLIKDSLISFSTGLISPLIISLFPGIFRILALKKHYECLYKFSIILQKF